jgi:hypothetical protein
MKPCDLPLPLPTDLAARAKAALERVCSGAGLDPLDRYYSPAFVDHVNDLVFRGLAGTTQSVALYKWLLDDLSITVTDQVVQGAHVTSRFIVTGRRGKRRVAFGGITISRFEDGLIVEDWSVVDTLSMVRQIGPWRAARLALAAWRSGAEKTRDQSCG